MVSLDGSRRPCWCGNDVLVAYSATHRLCQACDTLVSQDETPLEAERQPGPGRHPETDLAGRGIRGLKQLLRHRLPPARVLQVGAGDGGLVALMGAAGFDAAGQNECPAAADRARRTYAVPMLGGPLVGHGIEAGSLDVVVLDEILERMPDPLEAMACWTRLLQPDGLLMIRTSCPGAEQDAGARSAVPHAVYRFGEAGLRLLLARSDLGAIACEPSLVAGETTLFASRTRLVANSEERITAALHRAPGSRLVAGWLETSRQAEQTIEELHRQLADRDEAARRTPEVAGAFRWLLGRGKRSA